MSIRVILILLLYCSEESGKKIRKTNKGEVNAMQTEIQVLIQWYKEANANYVNANHKIKEKQVQNANFNARANADRNARIMQ